MDGDRLRQMSENGRMGTPSTWQLIPLGTNYSSLREIINQIRRGTTLLPELEKI